MPANYSLSGGTYSRPRRNACGHGLGRRRHRGSSSPDGYHADVSEDQFLFPDDEQSSPVVNASNTAAGEPISAAQQPAPNWQIDMIRRALDAQQLQGMEERRATVEAILGRSVNSLRELTADEVRSLLHALAESSRGTSGSPAAASSSWDDREHDTWIDRL